MAQIHCYIPDAMAERLQVKAHMAHMSVSKYLAQLVKKELDNQWPDDFLGIFGGWQGEPLARPDQGDYEVRGEH